MHTSTRNWLAATHPQDRCAFAIVCGIPAIEQLIVEGLNESGFYHDPQAATLVLIDAPYGFALVQLEASVYTQHRIIVITNSPCPEYWDDVWDLHSACLLVSDCLNHELEAAMLQVARGERYHLTPQHTSPLAPCERAVLRYVARGQSNQQIANLIGVSTKRVANTLTDVYEKLRLSGRGAAILYYWGRLDLLSSSVSSRPL